MNKDAIGIIDVGMESFFLLPALSKAFKRERFVYINDLKNEPYEGKTPDAIMSCVQKNIMRLQEQNIKLLIVGSDVIWEYCQTYLQTLKIPIINIVDTLINYVNEKFEQKNICLLAKNSVLEANLYQKNIKYNHLYSLPSDELEAIINNNMTKTTKAFYTAKVVLLQSIKKDVDVVITSSPFLNLMKIEIEEYLKGAEITNVADIWIENIKASGISFHDKKRGGIVVVGNVDKKTFKQAIVGKEFSFQYRNQEEQK
jgi:glutamate racemase